MLSTSCIETTRRIGTLVYIEIFSRTFSLTGLRGAAGDDVRA